MYSVNGVSGAAGIGTYGSASARTNLLQQTYNISVLVDRGAKGMWPTKPLELLQAAKQIAGPGQSATDLLKTTWQVSQKVDAGAKGMWPTKVMQLLQRADQIAGA